MYDIQRNVWLYDAKNVSCTKYIFVLKQKWARRKEIAKTSQGSIHYSIKTLENVTL